MLLNVLIESLDIKLFLSMSVSTNLNDCKNVFSIEPIYLFEKSTYFSFKVKPKLVAKAVFKCNGGETVVEVLVVNCSEDEEHSQRPLIALQVPRWNNLILQLITQTRA
jgi:hypothetical protein